MSDLFQYTVQSHIPQTSKITGELLEDLEYSKIGAKPLNAKVGNKVARVASLAARISQKDLDFLEADWKELSLDFAQLGLTVVGLIEVAEPLQMAADVANGCIDIKRGHPIIGAISIFSATPVAGLIGGIPLALIRAFKCVYNSLKFLCKSIIVLAVKTGCSLGKFICLRRGILLRYSNNLKRFVDNGITKGAENLSKVSETVIQQIKAFGEKLAKEKATIVNKSSQNNASSSLVESLQTPLHKKTPTSPKENVKNNHYPESANRMNYILRTNTGKPSLW